MILRKKVNSIHFIGICGTAMGSVAAMCQQLGYAITGSDEHSYPPMSTFLMSHGISLATEYHSSNLDHLPDLVVVGNAMKRGNPEVERLLDDRWDYCSLPELFQEFFLRGKHSIVVAGTHGKTTISSLLAWVLESAGLSPGFLIGGLPTNFGMGARVGDDKMYVVEGDEYDTAFFDKRSKFVHYQPDIVILNNIEFDHADIFPDLDAVKRSFRQLVSIIPRRGLLIANREDPAVCAVTTGAQCRVLYFDPSNFNGYTIPLSGAHNVHNAAAVAVCASELGLSREQIQQGFSTFRGIKRRMEVRGEVRGVTVLDDFAHHPTALAQTILAIREKYPERRVWALFEPRSNTTRRSIFQQELADSLALADGVFVGRVDRVTELAEEERLNPELVVETVRQSGTIAEFAPTTETLLGKLVPQLQPDDLVAVFSNGQFDGIHEKLLDSLRQST